MKSIRFHEYGGPEKLLYEDVPTPKPGPGEVLIKVQAAGVNYADAMRRQGAYLEPSPFPYIPGMEAAGPVEAVGKGVTSVAVGARAIAIVANGGGYAEYAVAASDQVIPLPTGLEPAQSTALIVQGLTAYLILKHTAALQAGQSVLVHSAAGGVGTLAVQLAKLLGAGRVIATAGTEEKLAKARSLGADVAVNYSQNDWIQQVIAANGGQGVNLILESVGGDVFERSFEALAPFGNLVAFGASSGQLPTLNGLRLLGPNHTVSGFYLGGYFTRGAAIPEALTALMTYVMQGQLKIPEPTVFPLEQAAEAHRQLQGRKTTGKIVLAP